jgi:hypothetical protein
MFSCHVHFLKSGAVLLRSRTGHYKVPPSLDFRWRSYYIRNAGQTDNNHANVTHADRHTFLISPPSSTIKKSWSCQISPDINSRIVSNVPTKNSWVCPCHFCIVWLTSRYIPVYHYSRFDRSLDTLDSSVVKRQRQFSFTIQPSQEGESLGYRWTFAVDCARNFDLNRAADRSEHTHGSTELWRLYPLVKCLVRWLPWESHNFVYRVASIKMFGSLLSAVSHSFVSTSCVCVCYNGKQGYA